MFDKTEPHNLQFERKEKQYPIQYVNEFNVVGSPLTSEADTMSAVLFGMKKADQPCGQKCF